MKVIHSVHPDEFKTYQTELIRERFLIGNLIEPGKLDCVYTHYDRMIIGAASPVNKPIELKNYPNLRARYFLERREIGIINLAGDGEISADGQIYAMNKLDCLYVGKGTEFVSFSSNNPENPAIFYLLSAPAHAFYPTTLMTIQQAVKVNAGDALSANRRTINKYIHMDGIKSCQLVMGLTILQEGSIWNTMPPHTHDRRTEVYFYFDLPAGQKVFHYMGQSGETRHIALDNYQAVVSPSWSIHSGAGTSSYSFIWGMAGENLDYTDMDTVAIQDLK